MEYSPKQPAHTERLASDSGAGAYGTLPQMLSILGGERVVMQNVRSKLDAHALLLRGLPHGVISYLVASIPALKDEALLKKAVGMSLRTSQRRMVDGEVLTAEQSSKTWNFAEVMARGATIFGSKEAALDWLNTPAIALDGACPIDLMATSAGNELVKDLLTRLEYGVYS